MKVPYYQAKCKKTGNLIEGFYFEMPRTTYCFNEDYDNLYVEIKSYLVFDVTTDWGLPNEIDMKEIDKTTLTQVGWIDTSKNRYKSAEWVEWIEK